MKNELTDSPSAGEANLDSEAEANLDRALARLPAADLPPLAARSLLMAAERRLHRARSSRWIERYEPPLLAAFAAGHLVWAVLRIVAAGSGGHLG